MRRLANGIMLAAAVLGLGVGAQSRTLAGTIVVTPSNLDGWSPIVTDSSGVPGGNPTGSATFVTGPATPPLGVGSVNLATGNGTSGGDGSAQMGRNTNYAGIPLSSITSLSYSTYVTSTMGNNSPILISPSPPVARARPMISSTSSRRIRHPGPVTRACQIRGATQLNTWQTWNALTGGWYSDSGVGGPGTAVVSLATYEADFPNATLENAVSGLGGIRP